MTMMHASTKTRLWALLVVGLVFSAGVAVGTGLDWGTAQAAPDREAPAEEGEEEERESRGWILDELDLTPEQREEVDALVDHFREELKQMRRSYRKDYDDLVQEVRGAVMAVLDEDQQARYEELLAEHDRKRER